VFFLPTTVSGSNSVSALVPVSIANCKLVSVTRTLSDSVREDYSDNYPLFYCNRLQKRLKSHLLFSILFASTCVMQRHRVDILVGSWQSLNLSLISISHRLFLCPNLSLLAQLLIKSVLCAFKGFQDMLSSSCFSSYYNDIVVYVAKKCRRPAIDPT
jgi:hypothetical protein